MSTNRIYNHTDRELTVVTKKGPKTYETHKLLAQGVSPRDADPLIAVCYDHKSIWNLEGEFDVHVTELGVDSSIGAGATGVAPEEDPNATICVFGLGVLPSGQGAIKSIDDLPPVTDAWFYQEEEIWVTVLGAGITGLSAAHELVTRGFRVQVIERAHGSPTDSVRDEDPAQPLSDRFRRGLKSPDVGGIARTQWATQPLQRAGVGFESIHTEDAAPDAMVPPPKDFESLRSVHGDAIWFGPKAVGARQTSNYFAYGVPYNNDEVATNGLVQSLSDWLAGLGTIGGRSLAGVQLVVVVYGDADRSKSVQSAYGRLDKFMTVIAKKDPFAKLQVLPTARIDIAEPRDANLKPYVGLMVRVHDDLGLIAGEHGFRFFPGFYRHLRDTMGRTPVYDTQTQTFTPRTALDNLQEVEWQVIADPTRRQQTPFARRPFSTIGGLIEQYRALRRDIGYRPSDLLRFTLRILRYATSSTYRRRTLYETMSWWDFLSLRRLDANPKGSPTAVRLPYGARFKEALIHSPKALVAMGSEFADARTQGNLSVQLLMDQFGLHDQGDSTLNGPTSTAWLANWKTYLQEQGVQFFLGEVTKISQTGGGAQVEIRFPQRTPPIGFFDPSTLAKKVGAHYFLSALDVVNLARVSKDLRSTSTAFSDLNALVQASRKDRDLEDIKGNTGLGDRFQTLTGIQLYYERHVSFANGHLYFAESPWGLSAISQVQFWGPFGSGHRGKLTGNLSIDIGSWRRDDRKDTGKDGKPIVGDAKKAQDKDDRNNGNLDPNALTRDQIALNVERQIDHCTRNPGNGLRKARYYHLDDFIGFVGIVDSVKPGKTKANTNVETVLPYRNYAPFLINVTGDWSSRPRGEPWSPNSDLSRDRIPGVGTEQEHAWFPTGDGYPVYFNNLVVAGPHMRTYTRMATMEAANESARHAVNAILDHVTCMHPLKERHTFDKRSTTRADPDANINVAKNTTPYGDYCDIWDPEAIEFVDLDFLRTIDKYLMEAGQSNGDDRVAGDVPPDPPHLFDILKLDDLPDYLEADKDALAALEGLGAVLKAFENLNTDELPNMGAAVAKARAHVAMLLKPF